MASKQDFKSPFTSSFNTATKRGTPASFAVANIAKRTKKSLAQIFESLYKAGQIHRQRVNGQWVFWPVHGTKANASMTRTVRQSAWQAWVDWAIASGWATPEQISSHTANQQQFTRFVQRAAGTQNNSNTRSNSSSQHSSTSSSKSSTASNSRRTSRGTRSARSQGKSRAVQFQTGRSSTTRRHRRAA